MQLPDFQSIKIQESNEPLVDLSKFDFVLEPYYFQQGLAQTKSMFLREGVVSKLLAAQKDLKIYKFKIWDGYRPRPVQKTIYHKFRGELREQHPDWNEEQIADEAGMYVTYPDNPARIPHHSTGGAADLSLVDGSGKELDMGTPFDHFGPEAWQFHYEQDNTNEAARNNRTLLRNALLAQDFNPYPYEWWHFDYGDQLWAASRQKPFAIYGELSAPTS